MKRQRVNTLAKRQGGKRMWEKIIRQIKWWKYAAWTLPFVAVFLLLSSEILGSDWKAKVICGIITVFLLVSVFWWWWCVDKIKIIFAYQKANELTFKEVLKEIRETKKMFENDKDNWQRRK